MLLMRLVFGDAREWKYLVESLAALIDEACFKITPDGLTLRALDPSRIAMVDLSLPQTAFEEFECEEETVIGVNFAELKKVMKRARKDEKVELSTSASRFKIKIMGRADRTFSLPILDIPAEEIPAIKVDFKVKARMLSDSLKDALSDADLVSDSVKFEATEDLLRVSASSDKGEVTVDFSLAGGSLLEYEVQENSTASYSLEYLLDMVKKASALSDVVTVEFATAKPISLTFEIAGGGILRYFLAPRAE
ncbi:MAG: proliferating cell nuclear antigen (pcna) [Thermoprotei archaeon]|nr:MAG: proliferating cell nuclear antigen (pcna) [Thermoprotei archaeon]